MKIKNIRTHVPRAELEEGRSLPTPRPGTTTAPP